MFRARPQASPMASPVAPVPKKKLPILQLAVIAVVFAGVALFFFRGFEYRGAIDGGITRIRDAGPVVFFGAMLLLPAFGVPMLFFTIVAGEAFAPRLGMPWVVAISLAVVALNLALTYWVARYALRPLLTRLAGRYGYAVPRVTRENVVTVVLLVRLTPGVPYAVQAYLLGLAETPFRFYLFVSWLCLLPWVVGPILMGKGIREGSFTKIMLAGGLLLVAVVAVRVLRKKFAKRES